MGKQRAAYKVSIQDEPARKGALRFAFARPGAPRPTADHVVTVEGNGKATALVWDNPPAKESAKAELEEIARARFAERAAWIERVARLVTTIDKWARELGWVTKRIEKRIEDPRLGDHKAPALVMQDDFTRMALEPISATAMGADGVVDLYLMPGYDDIASLYHEDGGWRLQYV